MYPTVSLSVCLFLLSLFKIAINSQNFKRFFYFFFWKNPSWYVTGIYCMGYTLVTVHEFYLWWSDTFIFIIHFNYTCSMYTNLLVIFWSACSDEFYFCFACFKSSHWMSFLSLVLIHVWRYQRMLFSSSVVIHNNMRLQC